ncbi:MAG: sulfite exporter TauE/SafE family protein [Candidatus Omnitrophota bacterium]
MGRIIISLFIFGLLLSSGPCLITCGPVLISYIVAAKQNIRQGVLVWLLFSLARVCVYLILSLSIFILGELFLKQNLIYISNYVYFVGGIIIILIGIFTIFISSEKHNPVCPINFKRMSSRFIKMQPVTLGLIMGLLPCAPLLAALSYIGLISFSWQRCVFYSLVFGLGTIISPLALLALGAGLVSKILSKKPKIYLVFRIVCGFIIVFFGAQLIIQMNRNSFF